MRTVEEAAASVERSAERICAAHDKILWQWGKFRGPFMPEEVFDPKALAETPDRPQTTVAGFRARAIP